MDILCRRTEKLQEFLMLRSALPKTERDHPRKSLKPWTLGIDPLQRLRPRSRDLSSAFPAHFGAQDTGEYFSAGSYAIPTLSCTYRMSRTLHTDHWQRSMPGRTRQLSVQKICASLSSILDYTLKSSILTTSVKYTRFKEI